MLAYWSGGICEGLHNVQTGKNPGTFGEYEVVKWLVTAKYVCHYIAMDFLIYHICISVWEMYWGIQPTGTKQWTQLPGSFHEHPRLAFADYL